MYGTKKFSPPGHWESIIGIAAEKSKADFPATVYAYAKTSIAMFGAFIQCWQAQYEYTTPRPITVINKYIDNKRQPYLQTPPFPEYTCGHSTCSSAAEENNCGRFYGGIHFHPTCIVSTEYGRKVGNM